MTLETETVELLHSITDEEMVEFQALKSIAQKILQAQDNGTFGLLKERERIILQLREVVR